MYIKPRSLTVAFFLDLRFESRTIILDHIMQSTVSLLLQGTGTDKSEYIEVMNRKVSLRAIITILHNRYYYAVFA